MTRELPKVLMISMDRNVFIENSSVRRRMIEYASITRELHIIVFAKRDLGEKDTQIRENAWIYPTNSWSRGQYVLDAIALGKKIAGRDAQLNTLITTQDPFETGLVGRRLARAQGIPLQVQVHTDFLSPHFKKASVLNRVRVQLAYETLRYASTVRVVSNRIRNSLVSNNLAEEQKIDVLPVYVDAEEIESRKARFDLQKKYPHWSFILLMASRLAQEKDFDTALRAFKEITILYPKAGLLIVGSGPERAHIERLAKDLGIVHKVALEGWQDDLTPYYKGAHAFLSTSMYEGYGISLLEAALSRLPIVTTDVGLVGDILIDEKTALVCDVGDVHCISEKIKLLMGNNQLREQIKYSLAQEIKSKVVLSKEEYLRRHSELFRKTVETVVAK